jgi:general secretion pathway protein A
MMYAAHFGCREHPFHITPDPRFLYANDMYEEAYANLLYGVRERKGFLVLTGEVGTGKTMLLRRLMDELSGSVPFVFFYNTRLNFEEMLDFICQDFGLSVDSHPNRLQKIQTLNEFLLARLVEGSTGVLIIDEAQNLDDEVLENLRLLSNLETSQEKLLQIVLVGQPELDRKLAQTHLRQLKQRVVLWSRLSLLPDREVGPFIRHRLHVAGCEQPEVFSTEAIQRITFYAKGAPRLINVICDNALLIAFASSRHNVTVDMVEEVAYDLGLREGAKPLVWRSHYRAQPSLMEDSATSATVVAQPDARTVSETARAHPARAEQSPSVAPLSLHELAEEHPVPVVLEHGQSPLLTTPSLEAFTQSRTRQTLLVVASMALIFVAIGIPNFFSWSSKHEPHKLISNPSSASLPSANLRQEPASPFPSSAPSSSPPSTSSQTKPTAHVSLKAETPAVNAPAPGSSLIPTTLTAAAPAMPPRKKDTALPAAALATKEVGLAATPSPQSPLPAQPSPATSLQEQKSKPTDKKTEQPAPDKLQSSPQRTEEQVPLPKQKPPSANKQEEARLALEARGVQPESAAVLASIEQGDIATLGLLLTAGVSPNTKDPKGWSALMLATIRGHATAVRALLASGAEVNEKNEAGGTALMLAAIKGNQDIVQTLLSSGATVNIKNREGWTPLMYAAWNGHVSAVRTFMDKGADVNARNQEGWTPLMCAASKGHVAAAQALLSRGAEAQAKNKEGETARQLAARRDYDDVIKLLQPDEFEE